MLENEVEAKGLCADLKVFQRKKDSVRNGDIIPPSKCKVRESASKSRKQQAFSSEGIFKETIPNPTDEKRKMQVRKMIPPM